MSDCVLTAHVFAIYHCVDVQWTGQSNEKVRETWMSYAEAFNAKKTLKDPSWS